MIKNVLLSLFISWFYILPSVKGQDKIQELNTFQMLKDFDYLVDSVIPQVFAKKEVYKKTSEYDMSSQIEELRKEVENLNNSEGFPYIIQEVLNLTGDEHSNIMSGDFISYILDWSTDEEKIGMLTYVDTSRLKMSQKRYAQYNKEKRKRFSDFKFYIHNTYINGEYYNIVPIKTDNRTVEVGDKIIKIFDVDIHKWIAANIKEYNSYSWDIINNIFYTNNFTSSPAISKDRDKIKITFESENGEVYSVDFKLNERPKFVKERWIQLNLANVKYFKPDKVLYVRLNSMHSSEKHIKKIRKYGKSKNIDRIIIDIRNNGGGNDIIWKEIIEELIDFPISTNLDIVLKNNDFNKKYLGLDKFDTVYFENNEYLKLDSRYLETYLPSSTSLQFKKKIILLVNKNIFSSAGSFASIGLALDKLIVVGSYPDKPIGVGITPFYVMLPESAILVQLDPTIDISSCEKYSDLFRNVDITVEETVKTRTIWRNKNGNRWKYSFLKKYDPFYQKAINVNIK